MHYSFHQSSKSVFSPSVVPSSTKECVGISKFTGIAPNEKMEMLMYQISGLYITIKQHVAVFLKLSLNIFYYAGVHYLIDIFLKLDR